MGPGCAPLDSPTRWRPRIRPWRAYANGGGLVYPDASLALEALSEASKRHGVRTLADRTEPRGVAARVADPILIDSW